MDVADPWVQRNIKPPNIPNRIIATEHSRSVSLNTLKQLAKPANRVSTRGSLLRERISTRLKSDKGRRYVYPK